MSKPNSIDPSDVSVFQQGGPFGEDAADYARERVAALARYTRRPILFAKVRLIRHNEPNVVVAKGTIDVGGRISVASSHGQAVREAIDLLVDKLRRDIAEQSRSRLAARHQSPEG